MVVSVRAHTGLIVDSAGASWRTREETDYDERIIDTIDEIAIMQTGIEMSTTTTTQETAAGCNLANRLIDDTSAGEEGC